MSTDHVIYVSHAGRGGGSGVCLLTLSTWWLWSLSRVLLSHDLGHYSLPDRDVSIKHVHIKPEWGVQDIPLCEDEEEEIFFRRERFSRVPGCGRERQNRRMVPRQALMKTNFHHE